MAVNWASTCRPSFSLVRRRGRRDRIADVLFGDANPAGRLPVTFYRSVDQLPPFDNYAMAGRTYRYMPGEPLYPFGHGLSYSRFQYANLRVTPEQIDAGGHATIPQPAECRPAAGDEVVQFYVRYPHSAVERPVRELKGFARVNLSQGEAKEVSFDSRGGTGVLGRRRVGDRAGRGGIARPGSFVAGSPAGRPADLVACSPGIGDIVEGFDPAFSFGPAVAARYDDEPRGDEQAAVKFLAELAQGRRALEFAIGTGRIALPLSAAGLQVDGIELSAAMVERLRAKPGGEKINVTIGDMSTVTTGEHYGLVYLVFNTIFNILTADDQIRCFENAARHLAPGGCFVVETAVPHAWISPRQSRLRPRGIRGQGQRRVRCGAFDPVTQLLEEIASASRYQRRRVQPDRLPVGDPRRAGPDGADRRDAAGRTLRRLGTDGF